MCHSHIAHFYDLTAPDFIIGPDTDPAQRNILGVVAAAKYANAARGDHPRPLTLLRRCHERVLR